MQENVAAVDKKQKKKNKTAFKQREEGCRKGIKRIS